MLSLLRKLCLFITNCYLFRYLVCEIKYLFMGMAAIAEDIEMKKKNKCDMFDLSSKVAVVTGGSRGIGGDIVKKLLQCNVHVIIGCRKVDAGRTLLQELRSQGITTGDCDIFELDLASFSSIKNFSKLVSEKFDKIHILVNNAGIMFTPFALTEDGYESQWGVNYLGPFLLTHLLFPLIKTASLDSECRIVNVSSCAHKICTDIDYYNLSKKPSFITGIAYANSKAAQILSSIYLSNLFRQQALNISVFAVHPGIVNTDLFNGTAIKSLMPWLFKYMCKDSDGGATSVLYPCISPKLSGATGQYCSNCRSVEPSKYTKDANEQKKLFLYTLELLQIKDFGTK